MTGIWTTTQDGSLRHKHAQEISQIFHVQLACSLLGRCSETNTGAFKMKGAMGELRRIISDP